MQYNVWTKLLEAKVKSNHVNNCDWVKSNTIHSFNNDNRIICVFCKIFFFFGQSAINQLDVILNLVNIAELLKYQVLRREDQQY